MLDIPETVSPFFLRIFAEIFDTTIMFRVQKNGAHKCLHESRGMFGESRRCSQNVLFDRRRRAPTRSSEGLRLTLTLPIMMMEIMTHHHDPKHHFHLQRNRQNQRSPTWAYCIYMRLSINWRFESQTDDDDDAGAIYLSLLLSPKLDCMGELGRPGPCNLYRFCRGSQSAHDQANKWPYPSSFGGCCAAPPAPAIKNEGTTDGTRERISFIGPFLANVCNTRTIMMIMINIEWIWKYTHMQVVIVGWWVGWRNNGKRCIRKLVEGKVIRALALNPALPDSEPR